MVVVKRWIETGDVWKDRARSVQLRLRDRFRVAVDSHRTRRRPRSSGDGYLSPSIQRWLNRFHDFRRDTLPSSSAFYRKTVSKDIDAEEESVLTRMLQAVAVPVIGNVCHVFMHGLNRVQIYGAEKLQQALQNRPAKKPLITVSNHVASMDDPLVTASLLPPRLLFDAHSVRWTLCATDRCFRNPVTSAFFKYVKVLPVSRGDGIYQKGMDMAITKLNRGEWVHIFPEGTRSRDGGKTMGSPKRGIGRLVLDADVVPLVVPFVHTGMEEIMPVGAKVPRVGKMVTVLIGEPIDFQDITNMENNENVPRGELYDAVAARIGDQLQRLKAEVEKLSIQQSLRSKNFSQHVGEQAARILQQVDWESLGMDSYVPTKDDASSSLKHVAPVQLCSDQVQQENYWHDRCPRVGFCSEEGRVSRIRRYMDYTELMGFAAKGFFINSKAQEKPTNIQVVGPLKAWNNFWKSMFDSCSIPNNLNFAAAM